MRRAASILTVTVLLGAAAGAVRADCNGNGVPDAQDIARGTSEDCDGNGVPDECEVLLGYARQSIEGPAGVALVGIAAADLDSDGDLDVVYATAGDNFAVYAQAYWRENMDGAGTFGAATTLGSFAGAPFVLADLDGDGDVDFAGTDSVTNLSAGARTSAAANSAACRS